MKLARITNEQKDKIKELSIDNTIKQISEKLGLKFSCVYSYCRKNNILCYKESRGGKNVKDLTNEKFGNLTVLCRSSEKRKYTKTAWWNCQCICGKICIANGVDLRSGKTRTCGCRTGIESKRNWRGYGDIPKTKWRVINQNSKQKNRPFNITIEYCDKLYKDQNKKCALSGIDINFLDNTASLDRIDSSKGYIIGNVQWVHKTINFMKQEMSDDAFILFCKLVAEKNK